jgi:restriction system protein
MVLESFHFYFIPILKVLSDQDSWHRKNIMEQVAKLLRISEEERNLKSPKGTFKFDSRIHWALTYLAKARVIERIEPGVFVITKRGQNLIEKYPEGFDTSVLDQFPEYISAWGGKYVKPHVSKNGKVIKGYYRKP